jgi:hypothetical protein
MTDPTTGQPFNFGYYIFTGLIAALLGFVSTYIAIRFYDHCRPHPTQEDDRGNRLAAKKVARGMAIAFALFWVFMRRLNGGP